MRRGKVRHAAGGRGLVRHAAALGLITGVTKISGNQWIDYGSFLSSPLPSLPAARPEARGLPSLAARLRPFLLNFFDISRRGHLQSNLWQSPQSISILSFSRSVSCAHTRWKSRPPERLRPLGSPARVRTTITFLGNAARHDYSPFLLPVPDGGATWGWH